jgi:hypothetical protein
MPQSPNAIEKKFTVIINAWRELAPVQKLADMTLDEFMAKVKPSVDARKEVTRHETLLADAINQRALADVEYAQAVQPRS